MINQYVAAGRLVAEPELTKTDDGKVYTNITLAIPRSYKNKEGEYDADFVDFKVWGQVATVTCDMCKKGDMLGVRGRIETNISEKDGKKTKYTNVIAEKVTFLAKSKSNREDFDR